MPRYLLVTLVLTVLSVCGTRVCADQTAEDLRQLEFFESKIRPVLLERCYSCHSAEAKELKGQLRLDTREGMRRGGEMGPAVVPGDADASLLLEAIRYEGLEMPPDGKLADDVIADFEKWIAGGARDPRDGPSAAEAKPAIDLPEARQFWSFRGPQRQPLPPAASDPWVRRPLDAFILDRLQQQGLAPSAEADRDTLIRRVTFDLIGLPPTPREVAAFVDDHSPRAYERLVERLLSSPHYGERLARMWLDVARYAEDQAHIVGNDNSLCYPNAYLYRDWVIGQLNADLPYDDFVRLQLAADLVEPENRAEHVALGFIGLGPKYYRRSAPEVMADEWEDRVDTVSRGLLGLTVACARCHDHKYDPIPTADYYALAGVFASTEMFNRPLDDEREKEKDGEAKEPEDALHIVRDLEPRDLNVHVRGDPSVEGPLVERRFLQVLCPDTPQRFTRGSGRLELAEEIVSPQNPLTARVLVNRIWNLHFGRPLVATPSNFGSLGERPTHPRLLDDLAVRFIQSGWSLKWLQREIVLSAAYRQSSDIDSEKLRVDPANRLVWRMNRKRLGVEAWRDAILAVAGRLDGRLGGQSIEPQGPDERRRTVYSRVSRLDLDSMLALFDFPDPNAHAARRNETTTPLQKLFVLNSPLMVRQADALAERLQAVSGGAEARIEYAYRLLYGRPPSNEETSLAVAFLEETQQAGEQERWAQYAQILLASNEMLMID